MTAQHNGYNFADYCAFAAMFANDNAVQIAAWTDPDDAEGWADYRANIQERDLWRERGEREQLEAPYKIMSIDERRREVERLVTMLEEGDQASLLRAFTHDMEGDADEMEQYANLVTGLAAVWNVDRDALDEAMQYAVFEKE